MKKENIKEGKMAVGKVVVITRKTADKEQMGVFQSKVPAGWKANMVFMEDGEANVIKELADAEYLLNQGGGLIASRLIENAKKLKLIQTGGQDVGLLPVEAALKRGIYVCNAGGANAIAVSEFTVLLMMMCLRRVLQFNQTIREGKWRGDLPRNGSFELYDKTVGIVGLGNIGRRVAHLVYAYGANVIYYERFFVPYALRADFKGKPVTLEELLKQSDIVSLHIPSFSANRALIGWEQLNMMKKSAYLVNTSRGANIDEAALIKALQQGVIAGAGIDVWSPEPPDPKNPLLNMPNVVAMPHAAATAWENTAPSAETVWRNVVMVSEGKVPLNRITEY
jgi:phosphoglycerate dehydrogenase-like enzyme